MVGLLDMFSSKRPAVLPDPPWVSEFAEWGAKPKHEELTDRQQEISALNSGWDSSYGNATVWDGQKYAGGLVAAEVLYPDYWTLRTRSAAAFRKNLFGRGLVRRLVTNVVNSGLQLNAIPNETALGVEQGSLVKTTDMIEALFSLWGHTEAVCDYMKSDTFGEIQKSIYREGLIEGDVLVIALIDEKTLSPTIRVVGGSAVQTPGEAPAGKRIEEGVEIDKAGRHVAYWIDEEQTDGTLRSVRIPAYGPRSGRRVAWLYYGTDKRATDVRGEPLLGIVLQSLSCLEKYRDATVLKATLNAILVASVESDRDGVPAAPFTAGSKSKTEVAVVDDTNAERLAYRLGLNPGVIAEHLPAGKKIKVHPTSGTDANYGLFESATIRAIAWANEIPPDVLELSFQNNFSASKGAQAEGHVFLKKERERFGEQNNNRIYGLFFEGSVLYGDFAAPGFLEAPLYDYRTRSAWLQCEWNAPIKPIGDLGKEVKAHLDAIEGRLTTREYASQVLFGQKFINNAQQLRREEEILGIKPEEGDENDVATTE